MGQSPGRKDPDTLLWVADEIEAGAGENPAPVLRVLIKMLRREAELERKAQAD